MLAIVCFVAVFVVVLHMLVVVVFCVCVFQLWFRLFQLLQMFRLLLRSGSAHCDLALAVEV